MGDNEQTAAQIHWTTPVRNQRGRAEIGRMRQVLTSC